MVPVLSRGRNRGVAIGPRAAGVHRTNRDSVSEARLRVPSAIRAIQGKRLVHFEDPSNSKDRRCPWDPREEAVGCGGTVVVEQTIASVSVSRGASDYLMGATSIGWIDAIHDAIRFDSWFERNWERNS